MQRRKPTALFLVLLGGIYIHFHFFLKLCLFLLIWYLLSSFLYSVSEKNKNASSIMSGHATLLKPPRGSPFRSDVTPGAYDSPQGPAGPGLSSRSPPSLPALLVAGSSCTNFLWFLEYAEQTLLQGLWLLRFPCLACSSLWCPCGWSFTFLRPLFRGHLTRAGFPI